MRRPASSSRSSTLAAPWWTPPTSTTTARASASSAASSASWCPGIPLCWRQRRWPGGTTARSAAAPPGARCSPRWRARCAGWQLATAAAATPLVSTQVEYSLLERGIEREVAPCAAYHGIGLLPWAPLGRGVLTGKYRAATPADSRGASPHYAPYVEHHRTERAARIVQAVGTAAQGVGTSPL